MHRITLIAVSFGPKYVMVIHTGSKKSITFTPKDFKAKRVILEQSNGHHHLTVSGKITTLSLAGNWFGIISKMASSSYSKFLNGG